MAEKRFMTIRETAKEIHALPEYRLRVLAKEGKLPGFYAGVKFMVNIPLFLEQLDRESITGRSVNIGGDAVE